MTMLRLLDSSALCRNRPGIPAPDVCPCENPNFVRRKESNPQPADEEKPAKVASTKILRMLLARDATLVTGRRHVHRDHLELGIDEAKRSFHRRRL
jgi:hypothetical protein